MFFTGIPIDRQRLKFEALSADVKSEYGFLFEDPEIIVTGAGKGEANTRWSAMHQPSSFHNLALGLGRHINLTCRTIEDSMVTTDTGLFPINERGVFDADRAQYNRLQQFEYDGLEGCDTYNSSGREAMVLGRELLEEMLKPSTVIMQRNA